MLTPVDIETVVFKKSILGYSREDVDAFLDKVIVEFEKIYKDNAKLQDKIGNLDNALKHYKDLEDTIKASIVTAERNAEQEKMKAQARAKQLILEAEDKANKIVQEANNELNMMINQILNTKSDYERVKEALLNLLETQITALKNKDEDFTVLNELFDRYKSVYKDEKFNTAVVESEINNILKSTDSLGNFPKFKLENEIEKPMSKSINLTNENYIESAIDNALNSYKVEPAPKEEITLESLLKGITFPNFGNEVIFNKVEDIHAASNIAATGEIEISEA